ncbi:hypothetical protein RBB50_012009 [Rhinocladiella similis]
MTRIGKCEICHQRKVKCDEVKPVCGSCVRVRRPCRYTYGKFSHFVYQANGVVLLPDPNYSSSERTTRPDDTSTPLAVLSLRSSYAAESGDGLFQNFASKPNRKKMISKRDEPEQQNKLSPRLNTLTLRLSHASRYLIS